MTPKVPTVEDPAGLDKLLLAAGEGVARYFERVAEQKLGTRLELWDGKDGLGAVMEEHLKRAGIPNKRLPEILTPRAVVNMAVPCKNRRPMRKGLKR